MAVGAKFCCTGTLAGTRFQARSGDCVALYAPGMDVLGASRSPAKTELVMASSPVVAPAIVAGVAATFLSAFPAASPNEVLRPGGNFAIHICNERVTFMNCKRCSGVQGSAGCIHTQCNKIEWVSSGTSGL